MMKTLAALSVVALISACAHPGEMPRVRAGNEPDTSASAQDRMSGRAAGAGGSHAPGGTGLGSGTMGVR